MTAATILVIVQILAAVAGADWSLIQIINTVRNWEGMPVHDDKVHGIGQDLLDILRGQLTPPTLAQLKQDHPDLHAQAVVLIA